MMKEVRARDLHNCWSIIRNTFYGKILKSKSGLTISFALILLFACYLFYVFCSLFHNAELLWERAKSEIRTWNAEPDTKIHISNTAVEEGEEEKSGIKIVDDIGFCKIIAKKNGKSLCIACHLYARTMLIFSVLLKLTDVLLRTIVRTTIRKNWHMRPVCICTFYIMLRFSRLRICWTNDTTLFAKFWLIPFDKPKLETVLL